jgi:nucleotide-binding universal stress UspA family protein
MKTIRRILFPVDFSARCVAAAGQVAIWAKQFRAEIIVLHVIDPHDYSADSERNDDHFYEMKPTLEQRSHEDLNFFCNRYLTDLNVRSIVKSGDTASEISSSAELEKVDLVMLPRHHQNIASRFIGDSITGQVLDTCPIAIWISEHVETLSVGIPKRILCALHIGDEISLDAENERLLETIRSVAGVFDAEVTCLYIGKSSFVSIPVIADRLAGVRHEIRGIGSLEVTSGNIVAGIQGAVSEHKADLLMVGRSRPGKVTLGVQVSILKIDHHAECPVLSVF